MQCVTTIRRVHVYSYYIIPMTLYIECDSGEVEDVVHWLIRCPAWIGHREALLKQCHDHSSNSDEDTTARLLCLACHNHKIAADIHTMWKARFGT